MTTSIEFDAVSNFSDEHATVGEQPISGVISGVQVVQASGGQTAEAGEPVPVDVGSGAPAKGDGNAQNAQSTAKPAADGNAPAANAPAGNAPAPNTAASNVAHEYHAEAGNVVKLPANVSIDDIKVDGHNLVLVQPDGAEIVIKDGALNVPTFIIGDVEVPRVALIAALEASHVDVAFGADGSISAGGNGSPSSAGGDFSVPPGGIGDGFGLTALLPPTALAFGQPENRELFPSLLKPDSTPSIGAIGEASVNEAGLPARNGEPAGSDSASNSETTSGSIGFTSPDGIQTVSLGGHVLTGAPQTFTDATGSLTASYSFDAGTGTGTISYSYTLLDNTSGDDTSVSFGVGVVDSDGDAAPPGTLTINIIDDVPTAVADTDVVPSGSHTEIDGNVITGAGSDGNPAGVDVKGADDVTVVGVAVGDTGASLENTTTVGTVIHGTYGDLTLGANGDYSYVRNAGSPGGVTDTFTYTIKDGDGDLSHTTLTISVGDSTPTDTIPAPGGADTTVYEAGLPARGGEPAGSNFAANSETTSGSIGFTSPDGIQTVSLGGHVLTGVPQTFTDATGSLTASYTYNAATGAGSISYTYTLLDNTSGDNTHASFAVVVTDADGDSAPAGNLVINIVDDAPTAVADTDAVPAGSFASIGGNVITGAGSDGNPAGADTKGADDATVVGVAKGTTNADLDDTSTLNAGLHGAYGTLTLHGDGSYTYVRDAGSPGGVTDTFTYTIKDGDGDLSHTTLTISVGDSTPTDTIPAPGGADTTVYEAGLPARGGEPAGSNFAANSETTSGSIGFTSPDGIQTVSLGGHVLTGVPQTFTDATGSLTASYTYNAATGAGSISYTYTLLDNTSGDNTHASFAVVVTDADGDSAPAGNLVINIVDDAP
ncbi:Ig-like domain-containing protein, partial [Mesorhizobium sp. WSM3862]|uniref:beta strand repeat-containing protein n=1 Tax=Mesorhizobium sp. WSM3862 TaxID=632858 RepID=UPI000BD63B41